MRRKRRVPELARQPSWHSQAYAGANGLKTSNPSALKSFTFLVATVNPCTFAVAAIMASSYSVSDFLCINRAHARKVVASIGKTL